MTVSILLNRSAKLQASPEFSTVFFQKVSLKSPIQCRKMTSLTSGLEKDALQI